MDYLKTASDICAKIDGMTLWAEGIKFDLTEVEQAIAAALAEAAEAAALAQMEADCQVQCFMCYDAAHGGGAANCTPAFQNDFGGFSHKRDTLLRRQVEELCYADETRAEWAAAHGADGAKE